MAYTKKPYTRETWENVPNPSEYEGDLNSLPRFDAENMNRIENGIENALNLTPDDIGAVPVLRSLNGVDILTVNDEGLYYCINTINMPTSTAAGYLRVEYGDASCKVIYWRAYNSHKQYVNVLNGGAWIGWSEILTNKGGEMIGDFGIRKATSPAIYFYTNKAFSRVIKNASDTVDEGFVLDDFADTANEKSYARLKLSHKDALSSPEDLLQVMLVENNTGTYKSIFGEHNREQMRVPQIQTRTYNGVGDSGYSNPDVTLTFDFVPKIVIIQDKNVGGTFMGENNSIFMINGVQTAHPFPTYGSSSLSIKDSNVTWDNTSVTFTTSSTYLNMSGRTYFCVALG